MEEFDLPDIEEPVEPTEEQEQHERELLQFSMQLQEVDDERRWKGIELAACAAAETIKEGPYTGFRIATEDHSPDQARVNKCVKERLVYVTQRDAWVERIVGPIGSRKKSRKDRERLEAEG